ncbi:MAG: ABC transporter permease [Janthinobacterium lividum]
MSDSLVNPSVLANHPATLARPVGRWRAQAPTILRGAVLPVLFLAYWYLVYATGWTDSKLFVPISKVLQTAWHMSVSGELATAIAASLARDLSGFIIGSTIGLLGGVLLGVSRWSERIAGPTLHTLKQISLFAWIPLITVWFGLGETSKVVFIALAAFFPLLLNTLEGVAGVSRDFVDVARVFKFTRWQLLVRVILPASLPSVFNGIYLALVSSWVATLGAEYLMSSGGGLGNLLTDGRENFLMDEVIVGMVLVGIIGFAMHALAARLEARLLRWRPPAGSGQ